MKCMNELKCVCSESDEFCVFFLTLFSFSFLSLVRLSTNPRMIPTMYGWHLVQIM